MTIPVGIIIPARGRPEKLARTLASIAGQDVRPHEVLVIDDGSVPPLDPSMLSLDGIDVRVIRHPVSRGPAAARNAGLRASRAPWISFLDSDDWLLAGSLRSRWDYIQEHGTSAPETLTVFGCGWIETDSAGAILATRHPREASQEHHFASGCWFAPGSCIILNRRVFLDSGVPQDEDFLRLEDLDWFLSLSRRGLRLRSMPLVGAAVERRRDQSPEAVEMTAAKILNKWKAKGLRWKSLRRLSAYLDLECASANFYAGKWLRTGAFLARSLAYVPRWSLQFSPGWHRNKREKIRWGAIGAPVTCAAQAMHRRHDDKGLS